MYMNVVDQNLLVKNMPKMKKLFNIAEFSTHYWYSKYFFKISAAIKGQKEKTVV